MKNIMVCVTQQKTCDRLIKFGRGLIDEQGGELLVIHVAPSQYKFLGGAEDGEALDYLYEKAKEYGAGLTVLKSDDVLETLVAQTVKNRIDVVVMGESRESGEFLNIIDKLRNRLAEGASLLVIPPADAP
jgi:K+-sensing histidine kinase KdpD